MADMGYLFVLFRLQRWYICWSHFLWAESFIYLFL